jgi:hypothetical protein
MSLELGVLFAALLWGPTALWLVYRTLRGRQGRLSGPFSRSQLAPDELEALVGSDGFWACGTCRSLNRGEANRCYSCRTAKGSAGRPAPRELPVSPGVPVMAEGTARSSRELPVSPGVPVMAEGTARSSRELPVSPGVPVMAEGTAHSSGEAARTAVALATQRDAPPALEILVHAPEHEWSAVPPWALAGAPACPFLGWRNDSYTRSDFPDPRNVCHATSERGAASVASIRRVVASMGGTKRSQPIVVEHQKSHCLTAAHKQCARYPADEVVAASR